MELIRRILQAVEADDRFHHCNIGLAPDGLVENASADALRHHARILIDGGYLRAAPESLGIPLVQGLTWKGHDFVEATRQKSIWEHVLELGRRAGSMTVDLALEMARELTRRSIRGLAGLD
ncbi:MAG: DUF2513 domain-containing protein [Planctomycetota bacterium]